MEYCDTCMKIDELQLSALSRINFCFYDLQKNPPLEWINPVLDSRSIERTKENYLSLDSIHKGIFNNKLFGYLKGESTAEARTMLIINYLAALLIKGKNNNISIHKNFSDRIEEITAFEKSNKSILDRIQTARDKLYAHVDLDWVQFAKGITFDELKICIDFLNKLFDFRFENLI